MQPPFDPPTSGTSNQYGFIPVDSSHEVHTWFSQQAPLRLREAGYTDINLQVVGAYYDTNWPGWRFTYQYDKPLTQKAHLHMLALMFEANGYDLPEGFWQSAPDDEPTP